MLDPRILARLVDPAALAPADLDPGTAPAPAEVDAALRTFLDATAPDLFPHRTEPAREDQPDAGPESPRIASPPAEAPSWDLAAGPRPDVAREVGPAPANAGHEVAAALEASPILLPAAPPFPADQGRGGSEGPGAEADTPDAPDTAAAAPVLIARPQAWPAAAPERPRDVLPTLDSPGPASSLAAGAEVWDEGPALIEPAALLPTAGASPAGASWPSSGSPAPQDTGPGFRPLAGRPPASAPGPLPWPSGPGSEDGPMAVSTSPSPGGGDAWGGAGGELSNLAPRLNRAAERLEAAIEQLARQAGRASSSAPRPFRGRVAE